MELFRRRKLTFVLLALGLLGAVILLYYKPYYPRKSQDVWRPVDHQSRQSDAHSYLDKQPSRKLNEKIEKPAVGETRSIRISTEGIVDVVKEEAPTRDARYVASSMKLGRALKMKLNSNQSAIVDAIKHAWSGYKKYAWGADELKPVSRQGDKPSYGLGMTLVDCLDTLWLAGLQEEFVEAREWVANNLDIKHNSRSVSLFETNIRVLGGLLSAYHLSQDKVFLDKATELGQRLLPAFDTPSGVPAPTVNLKSGTNNGKNIRPLSVAEAGTLQLEFRDLTKATGDPSYQTACDKDMGVLLAQGHGSIVPGMINPSSGRLQGFSYSVGAGIDSYYEYLLKQWLQSGKTENKFLDAYTSSVRDVASNLVGHSGPSHLTFVGKANRRSSPPMGWMDHLSCFYPGMLALGLMNNLHPDQRSLASEVTRTCYTAYDKSHSGLAPEIFHFNMFAGENDFITRGIASFDGSNILRPETVESLFYEYRLTGDHRYRDWGWKIFQAFEKHTKVPSGGYTGVASVLNPDRKLDKMESFFITETLKYLFLLFTDDSNVLKLDEWVFNTEAHPLPIWR